MDGNLICLTCDNRFDMWEAGSLMYCSPACENKYNLKWSKFKRIFTDYLARWLFWKPYFYIVDWIYKFECPICGEMMHHMGNTKDPHWLMCYGDDCFATFEYYKVKKDVKQI